MPLFGSCLSCRDIGLTLMTIVLIFPVFSLCRVCLSLICWTDRAHSVWQHSSFPLLMERRRRWGRHRDEITANLTVRERKMKKSLRCLLSVIRAARQRQRRMRTEECERKQRANRMKRKKNKREEQNKNEAKRREKDRYFLPPFFFVIQHSFLPCSFKSFKLSFQQRQVC